MATLTETITTLVNFGENFSSLLKDSETEAKKLGKRLNISRWTLWRYKNSMSIPNLATLKAIANYFDVSVDWLLSFHTDEERRRKCQKMK